MDSCSNENVDRGSERVVTYSRARYSTKASGLRQCNKNIQNFEPANASIFWLAIQHTDDSS